MFTNMKSQKKQLVTSFIAIDINGDQNIQLEELKSFFPSKYHDEIVEAFRKADKDKNGKLNAAEFQNLWIQKASRFARLIVQPRNERKSNLNRIQTCSIPVFVFTLTTLMIGTFIYDNFQLGTHILQLGIRVPAQIQSTLWYNPYKRHELWRYITYMFVHASRVHIVNNLVMQFFLGTLLEMVNGSWRVCIVYCLGVITGSLATSIYNPSSFLLGASAGVYALLTAHVATIILNWKEMEFPCIRLIIFTGFMTLDTCFGMYGQYGINLTRKVAYASHFGGAVTGVLVGFFVLKNVRLTTWEQRMCWISVFIMVALISVGIGWNIFYSEYFPPQNLE